jgi:glycosyltransferase involved in cell wall biosynthesis
MRNKIRRNLFITWAPSNTRSSSLAKAIDFDPVFIGTTSKHKNSFFALFSYIGRTFKNMKLLLKYKPEIIVISNFHWIISFVNLAMGKLIGFKVILDSHSAAFDHPFYKYPKFLSYLFAKAALFSIVTNEIHKSILVSHGAKAFILPDIPNEKDLYIANSEKIDDKFNICFICTFNYDEPYLEVFKAAEYFDNTTIYVTGNYKNKITFPEQYKNVVFTGFLSDNDFKILINKADAILVLTTRENTMQSGGSEAISVEKPLITSNTKMLKGYFKSGTLFVNNNSESIVQGILNLKANYQVLTSEIKVLKEHRKKEFIDNIEAILRNIKN